VGNDPKEPEVLGPAQINPSSIPVTDETSQLGADDEDYSQLPPEEVSETIATETKADSSDEESPEMDERVSAEPAAASAEPAPVTSEDKPAKAPVSTSAAEASDTTAQTEPETDEIPAQESKPPAADEADSTTSETKPTDEAPLAPVVSTTVGEPPMSQSLADAIQAEMAKRSLKSVVAVAKAIGVSGPSAKKFIEGKGKPNARTAPALMAFLGIDEAALAALTGKAAAAKSAASAPEAAPKKRGRPPKAKAKADTAAAAPKKRGRPAKAKTEAVPAEPKKRGRPPKASTEAAPTAPKKRGRPAKKAAAASAASGDGALFSVTILGNTKAFRTIDELKDFVARFEKLVTGD
jgi:hypothetical protein